MSLQMLGPVKYAAARDCFYILPSTLQTVAEHLIAGKPYKPLHDWLDAQGVTRDELVNAVNTFIVFMQLSQNEPELTKTEALDKSGWREVRWEAQMAVMYYNGIVIAGVFFEGAHEALSPEVPEAPTMKGLIAAGRALLEYTCLSRWQRWRYRRRYCRQAINFPGG
jgi:hypothetical protein